jgi:hypothetical protein
MFFLAKENESKKSNRQNDRPKVDFCVSNMNLNFNKKIDLGINPEYSGLVVSRLNPTIILLLILG